MEPGPSRRATRAAGVIKPEGVRALALADDIILLKVYELFCPTPHTFLHIIRFPNEREQAILNNCAFDAPLDVVRNDPNTFVSELERICSKVWEKAGLEVDSVRLNNLLADWRMTCYGSSTRLAYSEQHGLYVVARRELKKGIVNGASAVIVGIEPSKVSGTGIEARSRHLDWEGTFSPLVGVWFGPMRLVTSGCEKCRNVGYETWSTHGVGEIGPPRTVHQPLAVLKKPIPEGTQLWGKASTSERQCACPVPKAKHKPAQLTEQVPVIRLKIPKRPSCSQGGQPTKRQCTPSASSGPGTHSYASSDVSFDGAESSGSSSIDDVTFPNRRRPRPRLRVWETESIDDDLETSPAVERTTDTRICERSMAGKSTSHVDSDADASHGTPQDYMLNIRLESEQPDMSFASDMGPSGQIENGSAADNVQNAKRISILQVAKGGRMVPLRSPSSSPPSPSLSTQASSRLFWAKVSTPLPPPLPRVREQWSPPPLSAIRDEAPAASPVGIMQPLLRRWPIMFDGPELSTQQHASALHDYGLVNADMLVHAASALEATGGNIRDAIRLVEPQVENEGRLDEDPLLVKLSAEIKMLRGAISDKEESLRRSDEEGKKREEASAAQAAEIMALRNEVATLKDQLDDERRELVRLRAYRGDLQGKVADLQGRLASAALSNKDQLKKAHDVIQLKEQRINSLTQYQKEQDLKIESLELAATRVSQLAESHAQEVRTLKADSHALWLRKEEWKRTAEKAAAKAEKAVAETTRLRGLDSGTEAQIARVEEEGRKKLEAFKVELRDALSDEWARKTDNEVALKKEVERLRAENTRLQTLEEQWETMRAYIQSMPSRAPAALSTAPTGRPPTAASASVSLPPSPPIPTPVSLPDTAGRRGPQNRAEDDHDEPESLPGLMASLRSHLEAKGITPSPALGAHQGRNDQQDTKQAVPSKSLLPTAESAPAQAQAQATATRIHGTGPRESVYSPSRPVFCDEMVSVPPRHYAPREEGARGNRTPRGAEAHGRPRKSYGSEPHRDDHWRRSDMGAWRNDERMPRNSGRWRNSLDTHTRSSRWA